MNKKVSRRKVGDCRPVVIVSACLIGAPCRYDGCVKPVKAILDLAKRVTLVPVCPEQLGGLPTPRPACEIVGNKVLTKDGNDCTDAFRRGAKAVVDVAKTVGAETAVLKTKSPSCGVGEIKDGTFSRTLKRGNGVTVKALRRAGLQVFTEHDVEAGKI